MGVLTSFSVAKRVTETDIQKYFSKQKRNGKDDKQINEMIKGKILEEITDAIENNKIPGLLTPMELAKEMGMEQKVAVRIPDLNRVIMIVAHKLAEKNYDKMSLCYFINSLVNMLGLSEEDFQKFHSRHINDDDDDEGEEYKDA